MAFRPGKSLSGIRSGSAASRNGTSEDHDGKHAEAEDREAERNVDDDLAGVKFGQDSPDSCQRDDGRDLHKQERHDQGFREAAHVSFIFRENTSRRWHRYIICLSRAARKMDSSDA